jgi:HopJ type III effector protein
MKFALSLLLATAASTDAFCPSPAFGVAARSNPTILQAEIRGPTEKAKELKFGWDGTTALGGAVEVAKPARMLDDIRAAGETVPSDCEVFNANLEMAGDDVTFEEVMELIDTHYETGMIEFKNGDIVNAQGENEGSAKILSYAVLSGMDKATTLKLWGQYYREVKDDPDGDSHANIRNFMKYGWEGVPFENGIALTRKNVGDGEWDEFAESWIP